MHDYWYKKNKTQLLRGFCAVMEEGGILKASRKLNIAQSSISLQVTSLERDLGFQLFLRENQKLTPTEEAKRLYKVCKKVLTEMDMIFTNSKEAIKTDYDNIIRLAGHSYMLSHILPPYFKKMVERNPKVQFELYNISTREAMDMLEMGIIDFAVFPAKKSDLPKNIEMRKFFKCKFGLAIPKDHPLANVPNNEITWNMIAKYDFITVGKNITAQGVTTILELHGIKSRFTLHNGTWEIGTGIINAGLSISGTEIQYLDPFVKHSNVIIKECSKLLPEYEFHVLTNKNLTVSKSTTEIMKLLS